jgi:hypothetical protein
MRSKNPYPILFAVVALVILSLACATLNPTPGASNFYMATDEKGANKTNIFSPDDDFFVFFSVAGIEAGTTFQSRWYALDIEGVDSSIPFQTIDYPYPEGIKKLYFQLTGDVPWPVGSYKVEVYMNGAKVGEQGFAVQ